MYCIMFAKGVMTLLIDSSFLMAPHYYQTFCNVYEHSAMGSSAVVSPSDHIFSQMMASWF